MELIGSSAKASMFSYSGKGAQLTNRRIYHQTLSIVQLSRIVHGTSFQFNGRLGRWHTTSYGSDRLSLTMDCGAQVTSWINASARSG
jgi:hypothetical protein